MRADGRCRLVHRSLIREDFWWISARFSFSLFGHHSSGYNYKQPVALHNPALASRPAELTEAICMQTIMPHIDPAVLLPVQPVRASVPLGFIIRRIREINGVTQSRLAGFAEVNLSHICTVESGVNNLSIKKLLLICNALQVTPALLMAMQQNVDISASLNPGCFVCEARNCTTDGALLSAPGHAVESAADDRQTEPVEPACIQPRPGETDPRPDAGPA
jgi:transcriptional regulator with XRE-family HTH domain